MKQPYLKEHINNIYKLFAENRKKLNIGQSNVFFRDCVDKF